MQDQLVSQRNIAGAMLLIVALVAGVFVAQRSVTSEGATPFGDAVSVLTGAEGASAATVNGEPILLARIEAYELLASAPGPGPLAGVEAPYTPEEYLQFLIDQELLYQEALRRGYDPSDDEVLELARQAKASLVEVIDEPEFENIRRMYEQVEGTPYHYEVYDSSPEMLDGFRRQLAVNALRGDLIDGLPVADREDPAKVAAVEADLIADLKVEAEIEYR